MTKATRTFADLWTVTRAGASNRFNSSGSLEASAADTGRINYDPLTLACKGLLVEESRTNSLRNNSMQGVAAGTPGTGPTNWTVPSSVDAITRSVVGSGVENGVDYVDIRYVGTPSAGGSFSIAFEQNTQITASQTQAWTASVFCKLAGGSLANLSSLFLSINERDAGGASLAQSNLAITPTSAALQTQRSNLTATLANASAARVTSKITFSYTLGQAIDVTLRIGMPQLELGDTVTSVIRTTTAAATRSGDVVKLSAAAFAWLSMTEGTLFAEYQTGAKVASIRAAAMTDGTTNNAVEIVGATSGGNGGYAFINTGNVNQAQGPASTTAVANTTYKVAIAFKANDFSFCRDGGTVATDTSGTIPTFDRMLLGSRSAGSTDVLCGHIRKVKISSKRLTNAELQQVTA